jgi:hypothetical protein
MDIPALIADPISYIGNLVQLVDTAPDLGLNASLIDAFSEHPDLISTIPFVGNASDFQLYAPLTFLRLRASFNCPVLYEMVPLRLFHSNRWYTGLIPNHWAEPLAIPLLPEGLVDRRGIAVSTLSTLTSWASDQSSTEKVALSPHFQMTDEEIETNPEFSGALEVTVRLTIDLPDIHGAIYDFFGFFEETPARAPQIGSHDHGFYRSLPSFLCFAALPITSLYSPELPITPIVGEIRAHVMQFLQSVFDPIQAELVLLWLTGRVRTSDLSGLAAGFLALNFYRCPPEFASIIFQMLSFLCTTVVNVTLNCDELNAMSFRPAVVDGEFRSTVLSSPKGTRLLINETQFEEGQLTDAGFQNYLLFHEVLFTQKYELNVETERYWVNTDLTALLLSQSKSLLLKPMPALARPALSIPVGSMRMEQREIPEDVIVLMRYYCEIARNANWFQDDESNAIARELLEVAQQTAPEHGIDSEMTAPDLQVLMTLAELYSISLGIEKLASEVCSYVMELFFGALELARRE